ncbi:vWA domain-containing protein [Aporhodopirellula aestuarii]|uniref:Integrator complex subunit 14 n=1 Tax=Aporhodopirellula aestuarii TaxID=2950107 RepID=A0ABT0U8R6_9BACT|nr:BatA and WFA domain-containing protein [Aporhodopirellula aestuarii]MCM2373354.1 BatA and WFA domain-containing protein [Aporhodopirellula aestuarii]
MSLIPALTGVWPWLALVAVPIGIVLLYFLKLRREPVEVPSTFLWSRTIEDLHVNSLLQRLRNSILLFLQLLAVLLAALALFRPGVREDTTSLGRLVFLLDTSASMQAPATVSDDAKPITRFEQARQQIGQRIATMHDDETAMLITFSDRAEVMQAFTSDRSRLRDALDRCKVTNRPTDILGALRAADGLANPRRTSEIADIGDVQVADALPADLLLYSDGGFQSVTEFNLGNLRPVYHAMGSTLTKNLAIASFSANRDLQNPEKIEAFATVVNSGDEPATADASLYLEGRLVDAASVSLDPGDQTGVSFSVEASDAVRLRFSLDLKDDLSVDNTAYAALTPSGLVSVLVVSDGNRPLEIGLTTEKAQRIAVCEFVAPEFLETEAFAKRAAAGDDDLIIFDRCRPPKLPLTNTFTIGELPSEEWKWTTPPGSLTLIDIDRTHPVLRYLEMYSLLIFSGRGIEGPEGTSALIESDLGTVMSIAPRGGYRDLVLGFELVSKNEDGETEANTNWYAERSWPVFLLNVLRHLAGAESSAAAPSYHPGETVPVRLESAVREVSLVRTGEKDADTSLGELTVGEGGSIEIVQTDLPGNYQLVRSASTSADAGRNVVDRFAINLFDVQESRVSAKEDVELGYETIAAVDAGIETRREYWRPLLMLALAVLLAEWWLYTRRLS